MEKFLSNENLKKIKNILIKKSEGYFYSEEVLEYQNNLDKENKPTKQLTIFSEEENEDQTNKKSKDLTLVKKKVTTHYVPPDLLAIKMLIEIFGKEVTKDNISEDLLNLSDQELTSLKNEVIEKLNEL